MLQFHLSLWYIYLNIFQDCVVVCAFQPKSNLQSALKGHVSTLRQIHRQQIVPMEQSMVMPYCVSLFTIEIAISVFCLDSFSYSLWGKIRPTSFQNYVPVVADLICINLVYSVVMVVCRPLPSDRNWYDFQVNYRSDVLDAFIGVCLFKLVLVSKYYKLIFILTKQWPNFKKMKKNELIKRMGKEAE